MQNSLFGLVTFLYLIAFGYSIKALIQGRIFKQKYFNLILLSAFCLHTLVLVFSFFKGSTVYIPTFTELLKLITWVIIYIMLQVRTSAHLAFLDAFTVGFVGIISLLILGLIYSHANLQFSGFMNNPWILSHVVLAIVSYSLSALLGILGFIYLLQDYGLAFKSSKRLFCALPALWEIHQSSILFLKATVAVMTVTFAIGTLQWLYSVAHPVFPQKLIASISIWVCYTLLWSFHRFNKLSSRIFSWSCCISFIMSLTILWCLNPQSLRQIT